MSKGRLWASSWPTRTETREVLAPAILATCRSVLNTSSPAQHTLGDFVAYDRGRTHVDPHARDNHAPRAATGRPGREQTR